MVTNTILFLKKKIRTCIFCFNHFVNFFMDSGVDRAAEEVHMQT